jgi:hypothetical protein
MTPRGHDLRVFSRNCSNIGGKGKDCSQLPACVSEETGFAWNHGDYQKQITRTWFGMVGPGVKQLGRNDDVFSDHTDLRPTILALTGLKDDYIHDGRVLVEDLERHALPDSLEDSLFAYVALAQAYKQINATKGSVGVNSLVYANRSIVGDDATYAQYLTTIGAVTAERDALASQIEGLLDGAAFGSTRIRWNDTVEDLVEKSWKLVDKVEDLAEGRATRPGSDQVEPLLLSWPGLSRPPRFVSHSASNSEVAGTSPATTRLPRGSEPVGQCRRAFHFRGHWSGGVRRDAASKEGGANPQTWTSFYDIVVVIRPTASR